MRIKLRSGADTGYRMLHLWVESVLGKPQECWTCGDTSPRRYAWANRSGKYKKVKSDWERLCYSCHTIKDNGRSRTHCPQGHEFSGYNLIVRKDINNRLCRTCKNDWARRYRARRKAEAGKL